MSRKNATSFFSSVVVSPASPFIDPTEASLQNAEQLLRSNA
jgi:hypothetical protein